MAEKQAANRIAAGADAGNDTFATTPLDLYGRTRTQGQVDIGAVEFTPEADVAAGATMGRKKLLMLLLK